MRVLPLPLPSLFRGVSGPVEARKSVFPLDLIGHSFWFVAEGRCDRLVCATVLRWLSVDVLGVLSVGVLEEHLLGSRGEFLVGILVKVLIRVPELLAVVVLPRFSVAVPEDPLVGDLEILEELPI